MDGGRKQYAFDDILDRKCRGRKGSPPVAVKRLSTAASKTPLIVRLGSWSNLRKSFKTAVLHFTVPTPPFSLTSNIPQGSRMPTRESEYSLTSILNVSPALTDASSDSLKERTVQITFEDHVSDPDSLKTGTPAVKSSFGLLLPLPPPADPPLPLGLPRPG